ncbi:vacuolar protein sorting-associated protein 11 homolog [Corticium candelabrum]|uniref:vacuolar protein sorting-associated protein 11 homolog n=1 Tax=Corticium candelabrum TaxID=121492 RepID=UPI002E252E5D|nr:vacuolar protein sorting-associated protein 11 homolog [Corticium candelabrum]
MAYPKWRNYGFFDKELVKNSEDDQAVEVLKEINITVSSSGRGHMVFGDADGFIHFLHRNLQLTNFRAYQCRVSHLIQLKQHNMLISVGDDDESGPIAKVWNCDKLDRSGTPHCSRLLPLTTGGRTVQPISVIAVNETDHSPQLAVGYCNGTVTLIKDIVKERMFRSSQQHILHQDKDPITGLAFAPGKGAAVLYVVTSNAVFSYQLGQSSHRVSLGQMGCEVDCSTVSDQSQDYQFVVGRKEAIYFYQPEDKGPCFVFEGEKTQIHWFRSFLVVVFRDLKAVKPAGGGKPVCNVTIYDIQNKYIASSSPFPDVRAVLWEWGALYIVSGSDHKLYRLDEKSTASKLDILFRKNQYEMAINLARNQRYDMDGLVDIFRQYGDHLYSKGDYDGAIKQYVRTISRLEPSYVIRRFLDAQRIHNLTSYLEELHAKSLANTDHTTLLLNCYTKLKDVRKLKQFIQTDRKLNFDVETAIKVCRQASYFEHALHLAKKFEQHDWYLKIRIEDQQQYGEALDYIGRLNFLEAEFNLKKYGKALVNERPDETTELLKLLCTAKWPGGGQSVGDMRAQPEEFVHIFVQRKEQLQLFLEHMVQFQPVNSKLVYNTLLELYLQHVSEETAVERQRREDKAMDLLRSPDADFDIDHALVLAQMHDFRAGVLYLYERARLYHQILQHHMEHDDYHQVIETCNSHGQKDPNLWVQALSYFAGKEDDCREQIAEVLNHIEKRNLLPPLMVIQTLARNSTCTLAVVKDYVSRCLQRENQQIAEDEQLIKEYRENTEKMRTQLEQMKTSAKVFQPTKCHYCTNLIELPAVHFLCGHSYHQSCLEAAESESECPLCAEKNRDILDKIRSQEHGRELHEEFHRELSQSIDRFSVVAKYFGRGVFNKVTYLTEAPNQAKPLPVKIELPREIFLQPGAHMDGRPY